MTQVNTLFLRLLVAAALLLPLANAQAVEKFREAGIISSVSYDRFTIRDTVYRFTPAAKLESNDARRKKLSDLKPGDRIYFEGTIINGVYHVERVVYETPIPS